MLRVIIWLWKGHLCPFSLCLTSFSFWWPAWSFLDVWSAGCVLAELLLGQPIFPGDSGVDQLVEIIKVMSHWVLKSFPTNK